MSDKPQAKDFRSILAQFEKDWQELKELLRSNQVLKVTDHGCSKHHWRELTLFGPEAGLIEDILYNLPREGDCQTFVCEYGHTHLVSFEVSLKAHATP